MHQRVVIVQMSKLRGIWGLFCACRSEQFWGVQGYEHQIPASGNGVFLGESIARWTTGAGPSADNLWRKVTTAREQKWSGRATKQRKVDGKKTHTPKTGCVDVACSEMQSDCAHPCWHCNANRRTMPQKCAHQQKKPFKISSIKPICELNVLGWIDRCFVDWNGSQATRQVLQANKLNLQFVRKQVSFSEQCWKAGSFRNGLRTWHWQILNWAQAAPLTYSVSSTLGIPTACRSKRKKRVPEQTKRQACCNKQTNAWVTFSTHI